MRIKKIVKQRIAYIDIIKFWGISFLLFEHTGNWTELGGVYNLIKIWICSFHMPLFFIAYGMAVTVTPIKEKSIKGVLAFVEKRFTGLIIPYLLWCCIYATNYGTDFFKGIIYGTNPSLGVAATNQVLWFLPAIFLATLLYQAMVELEERVIRKNGIVFWGAAMILCGAISVCMKHYRPALGWWFGLDIAFSGCVFMIAGNYLRKLLDKLYDTKNIVKLLLAILLLVLGGVCAWANEPQEFWVAIMALAIYGKKYIGFVATACISTFAIALISILTEKIRLLAWLGENSLIIMAVHYIIFPYTVSWCTTHLSSIYLKGHCLSNVLIPTANMLLTEIICIPIIFLICRYMPILKGKRKG